MSMKNLFGNNDLGELVRVLTPEEAMIAGATPRLQDFISILQSFQPDSRADESNVIAVKFELFGFRGSMLSETQQKLVSNQVRHLATFSRRNVTLLRFFDGEVFLEISKPGSESENNEDSFELPPDGENDDFRPDGE